MQWAFSDCLSLEEAGVKEMERGEEEARGEVRKPRLLEWVVEAAVAVVAGQQLEDR